MSNLATIAIAYLTALASVPGGDEPPRAEAPVPQIETVPVPVPVRVLPPSPPPMPPRGRPVRPRTSPGSWISSDDYPVESMLMGEYGRTGFSVEVDPNGRVASCTIFTPSGFPRLDDLTCALVTRRARFIPAVDQAGQAAFGGYKQHVRWELDWDGSVSAKSLGWKRPQTSIASKERGEVLFAAVVRPDGSVGECRVMESSGFSALDAETCRRISQYTRQTPRLDAEGRLVPRRFECAVSW